MGVKPDHWIARMAREHGLIEPFEEALVREGKISFGPSSYGYDFRLAREFKVFKGAPGAPLDPKRPDPDLFSDWEGDECLVPGGALVIARSLEYFRIPRDVLGICFGKSTYARMGLLVNITPLEPEWEGHLTFSIANLTLCAVKLYAGEGIAQVVFVSADQPCRISYGERKGKYQAQRGIVLPRVEGRD